MLKSCKPALWDVAPQDRICFQNGVLDLPSMLLTPHPKENPVWFSTVQIPVQYDPQATCAYYDAYKSAVFPADALEMADEVCGGCLVPNHKIQEAIVIMGIGGNGKSTFVIMLSKVLGDENCQLTGFSDWDRFANVDLHGKLLFADTEFDVNLLKDATQIKKLISGEPIRAQQKYGKAFSFRPSCTIMMGANKMPESRTDKSEGFLRRFVIVPFDGLTDSTQWGDQDDILARLTDPQEKSGMMNHWIAGLKRLQARRRHQCPDSVLERREEFREANDPFQDFFAANILPDPNGTIVAQDLVTAYNDHAKLCHLPLDPTGTGLGMWIRQKLPNIRKVREGSRSRRSVYVGIKLAGFSTTIN